MGIDLKLASSLDAAQLRVVTHPLDGPHAFVVAGAGSGKTRCVAYRCGWLIEQGVEPSRITAVSFTKKSGDELGERIIKVHPERGGEVTASTYHSLGYSWLREWELCTGSNVWMDYHALRILRDLLKKQRRWPKKVGAEELLALFTHAKEKALLPSQIETALYEWGRSHNCPAIVGVWRQFNQAKAEDGAVEMIDMIWRWWVEMTTKPERAGQCQRAQDYFFVDEVQDLDALQTRIMELLARDAQVMAIGDPRQSIYAFRGADLSRLRYYVEEKLGCEVLTLDTNYRSRERIVRCGSIIMRGASEAEWSGEAIAHREEPGHVEIWEPQNSTEEAEEVCIDIRRRLLDGASADDIAIIYRQNAQAAAFERALGVAGVPYQVHGATSFFERAEIKDALAYLKLMVDPSDFEAAKRVRSKPCRYLGDRSWRSVEDQRAATVIEALRLAADLASSREADRFEHFQRQLEELEALALEGPAVVLERVLELRGLDNQTFQSRYEGEEEEDNDRVQNLAALMAIARGCDSIEKLLTVARPPRKRGEAAVHLMTVHKSKGLEFPYVYQVGVIGTIYRDNDEESRRILYVGATRAEDELVITMPKEVLGRPGSPSVYLNPLLDHMTSTEAAAE